MTLSKPQQQSLLRVYRRWEIPTSYLAFRRSVRWMLFGDGAVVVKCGQIWLAIEPNGYTHS